jgi:hypothetical protein
MHAEHNQVRFSFNARKYRSCNFDLFATTIGVNGGKICISNSWKYRHNSDT